jgi:hypothetical protein
MSSGVAVFASTGFIGEQKNTDQFLDRYFVRYEASILLRIAAADVSISETGRCLFEWLLRRLQAYPLGRSLGQLAHEGVDLRIAAMALEIGENFLDPVQIRMWLHR